jgi:MoaA/NifB/PqqE/SkfB family radical SAM enzyme
MTVYYVPHASVILSNATNTDQFRAEKILTAYDLYLGNKKRLISPWEIEIHLTGNCPFSCEGCSYSTRHTNNILHPEDLHNIFSENVLTNTHCIFFSGGGDPMSWKYWKDLLKLCDRFAPGISLGMSTNLFSLNNDLDISKIDFYQIHIAGYDSASYRKYSGIDSFSTVQHNLNIIRKSKAHIILKVLITESSLQNIDKFLDFLAECQAETIILKFQQNFLINQTITTEHGAKILWEHVHKHQICKHYDTIINNLDDPLMKKEVAMNDCYISESGLYCLVRENGDVYPCIASTYDSQNSIGSIKGDNLYQVLLRTQNCKTNSYNMSSNRCPLSACRHYRFNKVIEMFMRNEPLIIPKTPPTML